MAYNRILGRPFDFGGSVKVEDCTTSEEVMRVAKLDWTVKKVPLYAECPVKNGTQYTNGYYDSFEFDNREYNFIDNLNAIIRTDNNRPLGVVMDRYEPVQNIDAFKFFDSAIGKDKAIWQTAGCFNEGSRVFVSAKLPFDINVNGDLVDNYLVFSTSHDGTTGVKILFTPIRVICLNTLNAAIKNTQNFITFKHTKSVHDNIESARRILEISRNTTIELNEVFNYMNKINYTDNEVMDLFGKLCLSQSELTSLHQYGYTVKDVIYKNISALTASNISTKKANMMLDMWKYYYTGVGQKEIIGTAWGAYNAITGYYSNIANLEGTKRMDSLLYGDKAKKISLASELILKAAA